jgi:hypothetical protein
MLRMKMKHMLAQIDTDKRDLVHGTRFYRGLNWLSWNRRGIGLAISLCRVLAI